MNEEIAKYLMNRLVGLSFIEVIAGLVKTVTSSDPGANDVMSRQRYPVATDINVPAGCNTKNEFLLIPNSARLSIIYFEDFGTRPAGTRGRFQKFQSSIRLVCWYNSEKLFKNIPKLTNAQMIRDILERLRERRPASPGIMKRLIVTALNIPQMDAGIFGRYSYNEEDRQYLRPPFGFFAIDLGISFETC